MPNDNRLPLNTDDERTIVATCLARIEHELKERGLGFVADNVIQSAANHLYRDADREVIMRQVAIPEPSETKPERSR